MRKPSESLRTAPARRVRRGGAVLELCMVLPILLMLSFGVVEYGYYMYAKNTFAGAAFAGVRAGVTSGGTNTSISTAVSNILTAAGMQNSGYTVSVTDTSGGAVDASTAASGTAIKVTVSCPWGNLPVHALSSSFGGISSGTVVSASAVMQKEN